MPGFFLGVCDWQAGDLVSEFYPDGMPEDWRLAYYNTQFDCVWLPYRVWRGATTIQAECWLEDTRPEFRFLLEASESEDDRARMVLSVLTERTGLHASVDHPDVLWFRSGMDLRELAVQLGACSSRSERAVYLISQDGDPATTEKVRTLLGVLGLGSNSRVG